MEVALLLYEDIDKQSKKNSYFISNVCIDKYTWKVISLHVVLMLMMSLNIKILRNLQIHFFGDEKVILTKNNHRYLKVLYKNMITDSQYFVSMSVCLCVSVSKK